MPTNRETILQTFRTAFKTALSPALTDENCIPADGVAFSDDNPRPALPYITIKVTVADIPVGMDEQLFGLDGPLPAGLPTTKNRGHRSGTVTVNGFGTDTSGWLEVFALRLGYDSILRLFDDAGIAVINRGGGVTDISALVDTSIEPRFLREFEISYSVVDAVAETLIEAETIELDLILEDLEVDPDPLTTTIVIDI
jgi:hypothetical protein